MTPAELDRLEALCEAATPGPWNFACTGRDSIDDMHGCPIDPEADSRVIVTDSGYYPPRLPDAEFIAAARTALPALIAEVRRLRGLVKAVESTRSGVFDDDGYTVSIYECPWCNAEVKHKPDCPAFTPTGEVK